GRDTAAASHAEPAWVVDAGQRIAPATVRRGGRRRAADAAAGRDGDHEDRKECQAHDAEGATRRRSPGPASRNFRTFGCLSLPRAMNATKGADSGPRTSSIATTASEALRLWDGARSLSCPHVPQAGVGKT